MKPTRSGESSSEPDVEALAAAVADLVGVAESPKRPDEISGMVLYEDTGRIDGLRVSVGSIGGPDVAAGDAGLIGDYTARSLLLLVAPDASYVDAVAPSTGPAGFGGPWWLGPQDVQAITEGALTLRELICMKVFLRTGLGHDSSEAEYSSRRHALYLAALRERRSKDSSFTAQVEADERLIHHPYVEQAASAIKDGRTVVLIGKSSSGKSSLARLVQRALALQDIPALAYQLGDTRSIPAEVVDQLLFEPPPRGLLVVDDAQSYPSASTLLMVVLGLSRQYRDDSVISALVCTWPEYAGQVIGLAEGCLPLLVRPEHIAGQLIETTSPDAAWRDEAMSLFASDLSLLALAVDMGVARDRLMLSEMAESLLSTNAPTSVPRETVDKIVYVVACLGRYDIACPPEFLRMASGTTAEAVESAAQSGLLRREGDSLRVGHTSRCSLLVEWLEFRWSETGQSDFPGGSIGILVDYLQAVGPASALTTLRFIESLLGFRSPELLAWRSSTLVELWRAFVALLDNVLRQQARDPSWGATPSSCMYAVAILTEVDRRQDAAPTTAFLRSHLSVDNNKLARVDLTAFSTAKDFRQIKSRMATEDQERLEQGIPAYETTANTLDTERMHESWLLGVLLTAEAYAEPGSIQARAILRSLEAAQLRSGAFYPERVPWVTCRVLLGLAKYGLTIHNSEVVRSASEWLQRDVSAGGARTGDHWESGTGSWNSALETTAMAILSLSAVGIDLNQPSLSASLDWLLATRDEWTETGRELDGALALHTAVSAGVRWDDIAQAALQLSAWARGEALWDKATASADEVFDQSCRVAQIAADLVNVGWSAVRTHIPALVESLASPRLYRDRLASEAITGHVPRTPVVNVGSSARVPDAVEAALDPLTAVSLSQCTVIGRYRRFDEQSRNHLRRLVSGITRPLREASGLRENFLVWAPSASGKTFLISEIAASMQDVAYVERNMAKDDEAAFRGLGKHIGAEHDPVLVLIDEVDARKEADWPLESFFAHLDANKNEGRRIVFVMVGSKPGGLNALVAGLRARVKGEDLVSRVPEHNRHSLAPLTTEDRLLVALSAIFEASLQREVQVRQTEKLALYYALTQQGLSSPRQLAELAESTIARLPLDRSELRYDDMFERGDKRNQEFFAEHLEAAQRLHARYIAISP